MTNEMKLQNEVVTMESLDRISGGTVTELEDLTKAIVSNSFWQTVGSFESHVPIANSFIANRVEKLLKEYLHIDADISLGAGGSGLFSKDNKYKDMTTGKNISHQEVINRIVKFK